MSEGARVCGIPPSALGFTMSTDTLASCKKVFALIARLWSFHGVYEHLARAWRFIGHLLHLSTKRSNRSACARAILSGCIFLAFNGSLLWLLLRSNSSLYLCNSSLCFRNSSTLSRRFHFLDQKLIHETRRINGKG